MEITKLVEILQGIRAQYPSLTNDEILRLMELKTLMEIKARLNR